MLSGQKHLLYKPKNLRLNRQQHEKLPSAATGACNLKCYGDVDGDRKMAGVCWLPAQLENKEKTMSLKIWWKVIGGGYDGLP